MKSASRWAVRLRSSAVIASEMATRVMPLSIIFLEQSLSAWKAESQNSGSSFLASSTIAF